jgi:hypothetical protein
MVSPAHGIQSNEDGPCGSPRRRETMKNRNKREFSSFKNRLQTRRLCDISERRDARRTRVYKGQIANVLVRLG